MCLCRRRYSQYWRPGSITNANICKNGGPKRLVLLLKTKSERYAEQNGRMFQTTLEELCVFLGINILVGIHKQMRDYWSVDQRLVTLWFKTRWLEIDFWRFYRIVTFRTTSRSFHLKKVKVLIELENSDPLSITYWIISKRLFYQNYVSLSMNTCVNSRERALCASTWRISQSNGASNFGFSAVPSLGICINLICIWEKSPKQSLVLVNQLFSPENLKNSYCYMFFDNFFTSPNLMPKLFKDGIYATGTVRSNRKHRPTL